MRPDMPKVIVERPRNGHKLDNWTVRQDRMNTRSADPDDLVGRVPMKPRSGHRKNLNENLSPLYRFLLSNVGKKWDDVYSEISKYIKPGNTVQEHVRDHLFDFVEINTVMIDDKVCYLGRFMRDGYRPIEDMVNWRSRDGLYVHPITKLLCRIPNNRHAERSREKARALAQLANIVKINKHLSFVKIVRKDRRGNELPGVWFKIVFKDLNENCFTEEKKIITHLDGSQTEVPYLRFNYRGYDFPDVLNGTPLQWEEHGFGYYSYIERYGNDLERAQARAKRIYGAQVIPVEATSASKRDIKRYNLK